MKYLKTFEEFVNELEKKKGSDNKILIEDVLKTVDDNELKNARIIHPLDQDVWIYRLTIIFLGLIIMTVLGISVYMVCCCGKSEIPSGIIAIGATAVGALAGLISMSNKK